MGVMYFKGECMTQDYIEGDCSLTSGPDRRIYERKVAVRRVYSHSIIRSLELLLFQVMEQYRFRPIRCFA